MARPAVNGLPAQASEEFGEESYIYSKTHCLQREVKVEIESIDKGGNFIGQLFTEDNQNIAVGLVENGFAAVYKSAAASPYFGLLSNAELKAKEKRLNRWKNFVEEKKVLEEIEKNEPQERVISLKKIVITEVTNDLHFYGQLVENGPKLEQLSTQLRAELEARPPIPGAYTPKVGDICVAQFSLDDEWYRAKVLTSSSSGNVNVLFIDYGNREQTKVTKLSQIPAGFESLPAQAHEYALAMIQLSSDEDDIEQAVDYFKQIVQADNEAEFSINVEYRVGNLEFISMTNSASVDIGKKLVADGYVSVDKTRKERRLNKLMADYLKNLTTAKASHKNMWRYGDKEQDDAAEFGAARKP